MQNLIEDGNQDRYRVDKVFSRGTFLYQLLSEIMNESCTLLLPAHTPEMPNLYPLSSPTTNFL